MPAELPPEKAPTPWWGHPDGNDWLFLPGILDEGASLSIPEIDVLHKGQRAILRLAGGNEPLLRVRGQGVRVVIPQHARGFSIEGAGLRVESLWSGVIRHQMSARFLPAELAVRWDAERYMLALETLSPNPLVAWAMVLHGEVGSLEIAGERWHPANDRYLQSPDPISVDLSTNGPVHISVALDGDNAMAGGHAMRRPLPLPEDSAAVLPSGSSKRTADNLWFAQVGSLGRALDTGEWTVVTSRSPRYDTAGLFRPRDWFRWCLPALSITAPETARAGTLAACETALHAPGAHALDIAGSVVYPGFQLDQAADIVLGIRAFATATGSDDIFDEPIVDAVMSAVGHELARWHDPATGLFKTELAASGTVPPSRFLAVANARAIAAYGVLADRGMLDSVDAVGRLQDVWRTTFVQSGWVIGAVGDQGQPFTWDDPQASILSLPRLRILTNDIVPAWEQTAGYLMSGNYPQHVSGRFSGEQSPGQNGVAVHSLAERMFVFPSGHEASEAARAEAEAAPLDGDVGLACETFDSESGRAVMGPAYPAGAALLGRGLLNAYGLR